MKPQKQKKPTYEELEDRIKNQKESIKVFFKAIIISLIIFFVSVQRMILNGDYTIMSTKLIGDFIKSNLQSNKEYFLKQKGGKSE